MKKSPEELWDEQAGHWRAPEQVIGAWWHGNRPDPASLKFRHRGPFWDLLEQLGITLLLTREYEHLLLALSGGEGGAERFSYLPLPHPSGLAVDHAAGRVLVASTRNPNQILELRPMAGMVRRSDSTLPKKMGQPRSLLPARTWFYPGSLYMHDLAFVGKSLYANAVGHNAIVRLKEDGAYGRVWWPRSIDGPKGKPHFDRNYLQLNSIAAGKTLASSFFSASADRRARILPGHHDFKVDKRGVIFSGRTRDVICRGLTRPHSARLHNGRLFVDNSGYGELSLIDGPTPTAALKLPGWTRGLCFVNDIAFVGTSRVLPRFHHYAPGLTPSECVCAVHAVHLPSAKILASLEFPSGNQLFAIDYLPTKQASGLPFTPASAGHPDFHKALFYAADAGLLQE